MKKSILFLLFAIVPIMLWADPVEINGIYYNLVEKGKVAEVTENPIMYTGYTGSVVIPESVSFEGIDYAVKKIGSSAFDHCAKLTSVAIPNSVTIIADKAFIGCESLASITIPNSVTEIGPFAFFNCASLTSITIPNGVTIISMGAFYGCASLTSITIPNGVTEIGTSAFENCTSLTSITIPNGVTSIGSNVFNNCTSLTSITIPNGVIKISDEMFANCTSLTSITIPNSVTKIGAFAFNNCKDMTDVYCYADTPPYTDGSKGAFESFYIEYATLHVPANAINKYKEAEPWKNFGKIVALDGASIQKCETPTISYENGVLKMACATEGVEYVTDITDADVKKHYDAEISLSATYNISVYATKAGFENSDVVNATLCWIDAEPKTEGITNGVANVSARAVLIQNNGGIITINGVEDGMRVSAYSLNGVEEAATISRNGAAVLNTNAQTGSTVIVKMGEKSVKVLMK